MEKMKQILFYLTLFLFILGFSSTVTNYDYDFWARLIAGMGFIQTGHVLKQDFLSYTPVHTWFDHEWGSGVIFYLTQHFFSNPGILFLQAIVIFLTFFFIIQIVKLRGVKTTSPYNFLFYYFVFSAMSQSINELIRCQIFSFLFFTIFLYILELSRVGKNKPLFILPVLMIIWNNLHGGCVSGIGLILIYIIGEFLNKRPFKQFISPLILCVLVLPINPWGFNYLTFLFKAITMPRPDIAEWWGLFCKLYMFKFIKFKLFTLILLLFGSIVIFKQIIKKTYTFDATKFLIIGIMLFLAIKHIKFIPFATISMACFLYDDFYITFNKLIGNFLNKFSNIKDGIVYVLIFIFAISNVMANGFNPKIDFSQYPIMSIQFLKTNNIKGNLLIAFGLGSYASYKLYPNNKIFMDGRYEEVYADDLLPMLGKFYRASRGWNEVLIKYPPDIMIIEKFYPIYNTLLKNKNWKPIFYDDFFVVFVKSNVASQQYKMPSQNLEYYRKTLFDTNINFREVSMLIPKYNKKRKLNPIASNVRILSIPLQVLNRLM